MIEQYRIITIDMTQIDDDQKQMIKVLPGVISERSTILHQQPGRSTIELTTAIKDIVEDISKYENSVEDEKLDHVKGDME